MSRNLENHFSTNPTIDIQRSTFKRPFNHKTTFNNGALIPLYYEDVLPGDTVQMNLSSLVRMATPIFPVMDTCVMDVFAFFVPNRLVWEHWKEFMGENTTDYWTQQTEYEIPSTHLKSLSVDEKGIRPGTIEDYLGIPIGTSQVLREEGWSSLPERAYHLIYNEWFRNENTQEPWPISKGDENTAYDEVLSHLPHQVNKLPDMFTRALPQPQKGEDVLIPADYAPISSGYFSDRNTYRPDVLYLRTEDNQGGIVYTGADNVVKVDGISSRNIFVKNENYSSRNGMYAELQQGMGTINALRNAFAIQRLLEKDARGGTRYTEILRSHFNVISPDARLQRPEYLGGFRKTINMSQVVQTSSTDTETPQGNVAGYSVTSANEHIMTKSFTEHGMLFVLACTRCLHTYGQGLNKKWSKRKRLDIYWPALANIGEQAVMKKEIDGRADPDEVFGYQEAWYEYRYTPDRVSSMFHPGIEENLDPWHYADNFEEVPTLAHDFCVETPDILDRTLAVQFESYLDIPKQFIGDFYFDTKWTRAMPVYSIPGLVDHY